MNRRNFLFESSAAALSLATGSSAAAAARLPIRKAVLISMLPKELSYADRFKLAAETGFAAMECQTVTDEKEAEQILRASQAAKVPIHSVMNMAHWKYPLSSPNPADVAESRKGMEASLRNARLWGADTVLLVPAVVRPDTTYEQAWRRSQEQIRRLLPLAEQLKVVIAIEEVWNKFLLSPIEFAHYVDEFKSPWLKAYFDVGNVAFYGYPQQWIHTLNHRIAELHIKDFLYKDGRTEWTDLRDGGLDWKAIYQALAATGYQGTATVELRGGDAAYLRDVSHRFDLILSGA
ncbi:MAG: sugar phosphate isomerase/epimerase [Bryobacterales bacterium]|nr:sugar phosphate isomerase/epimerase [Bryobacterales bacterium]